MNQEKFDISLAVFSCLIGFMFGFFVWGKPTMFGEPTRLTKTDGVICIADADDPTGPHWLVRSDGWCYAEDSPALRAPDPRFGR